MYDQHGFRRDGKKPENASSTPNHLIALCLLFLCDKNLRTIEGEQVGKDCTLPKFFSEVSTESHGGDESMFKSLNYKKTSVKEMAETCLKSANFSLDSESLFTKGRDAEISLNIEKPVDKAKHNALIQEVCSEKRVEWVLKNKKSDQDYLEYYINLPTGTSTNDCELEISKVGNTTQLTRS